MIGRQDRKPPPLQRFEPCSRDGGCSHPFICMENIGFAGEHEESECAIPCSYNTGELPCPAEMDCCIVDDSIRSPTGGVCFPAWR